MERIALFSDVHSNVFALESAYKDAKNKGATHFVNLGDIFYGPIAPAETFEFFQRYEFITVCGNQDRQIIQATESDKFGNPTLDFVCRELGKKGIEWIQQLPFDIHLNDEVYLCHGTPESDLVYLLEDVSRGLPVVRSDKEIVTLLGHIEAPVVACGHSHIPRSVMLSSGQLIVNPGSVGLQSYEDDEPVRHAMENCTPHASYAMLEKRAHGWHSNLIRVPYDAESAASKAMKNDRADWAHFLLTGRKA
ncbi:metallophosphatase family protein [Parasalinivibrio latis]|uniref:metallophosphoesterase family protein n=1 Tax=Parasalinivibrio latis TaxID=2952610 RepID=UPI0030E1E91F